jgi:hypothetical protein
MTDVQYDDLIAQVDRAGAPPPPPPQVHGADPMQRQKTYALQFAAAVLMLGALYLGRLGFLHHNVLIVVVNGVLFAANLAMFVWQSRIRARLSPGPSIPPRREYTER